MSNAYDDMLSKVYDAHANFYPSWMHFEGRECFMVDGVIDHFRGRKEYKENPCTISVEFEKFGRPGLDRLMGVCDIAFVAQGYMREFLDDLKILKGGEMTDELVSRFAFSTCGTAKRSAIAFVTVGAEGAYIIQYGTSTPIVRHIPTPAISPTDVIETTGAGDTFIGVIIYAMGYKKWDAAKAGRVAVNVASRKCLQIGYDLLGNLDKGFGVLEREQDILDDGLSERSSVGPEVRRMEGLL